MDALTRQLARITQSALGTVVHIGAGANALDAYAQLPIERLVLVEGDPDTCSELQAQARSSGRTVEVVGEAVRPHDGPVLWHRYTLRTLNGPLAAGGLSAIYPRLRQWSTLPLPGTGLAELLERLQIPASGEKPNVLLLDVAGQEAALLAAIPAQALHAFEWILCRTSPTSHGPDWAADGAADPALSAAFFQRMPADDPEADPLWAIASYRFDAKAHELHTAQDRARSLQDQLAAQNELLNRQTAQNETLAARLAELEQATNASDARAAAAEAALREAQQLAQGRDARILALERAEGDGKQRTAEQAARIETLMLAAAAATRADSEGKAQLRTLQLGNAEAERRLSEMQRQLDEAIQSRDAQALAANESQAQAAALAQANAGLERLVQESRARIESLESETTRAAQALAEAQRQLEEASKSRNLHAGAHQELQARLEALALAQGEAKKAAVERNAQVDRLTQERDAALQLAASSQARLDEVAAQLNSELTALTQERARLQEAAQKQTERIEELEQVVSTSRAATDGHQARLEQLINDNAELQALAVATQGQVEELTKSRNWHARTTKDLQSQVESLAAANAAADKAAADGAAQIQQLTQARDGQAKVAAERTTALQAASLRATALEAELAEVNHQRQSVETRVSELVRALAHSESLAARLQVESTQLGEARGELVAELERQRGATAEIAAQRDSFAERLAALSEEGRLIKQAHAALEQQLGERKTQIDQLSHAEGNASKLAVERAVQIAQAARERDEQLQIVHALRRDLEARDEEVASLRGRMEQMTHATAQREQQEREAHARLERELAEARQTASLSVKLQTLRESDLRDLQERYRIVLSEQQSQHELLTKLTQRLSTANDYFRRLALGTTASVGTDERRVPGSSGEQGAVSHVASGERTSATSTKRSAAGRKSGSRSRSVSKNPAAPEDAT